MNNAITSLAELDAKLAEFESLPDDWDSYGGKAISRETSSQAREIFIALGAWGFWLVPCGADGVQIEIHNKGYDIEVRVNPAEPPWTYVRDAMGSEEEGALDIPRLKQLIAEMGLST